LQKDLDYFAKFSSGEINDYSMVKRYLRPDGSIVWVNMKIARLSMENQTARWHLCMVEDITELIQNEQALKESERSKSTLLANLPGMAYRCKYDRYRTMQFVSEGCFALTGYKPESLLFNKDLTFNDIISPEYREILWKEWATIIKENRMFRYDYPIITASGEEKWVYEQGQPIYGENGEIIALEGLLIDVTDKRKAQNEKENLLQQIQSMFNEHDAVMLLIEPQTGAILDANPSAIAFYGYSKDELLSMHIQDINMLPAEEVKTLRAKALAKKQKYFAFPHRLKNGEIKAVDVYTSPINYKGEKVLYSIIIDATERESAYDEIEYLRNHDILTHVYNRRHFEEIKRQKDHEECLPLSILMADINGVKFINDTFGDAEGDRLITETSRLLKSCIR
jgi:PAS domain S-box-containing protein